MQFGSSLILVYLLIASIISFLNHQYSKVIQAMRNIYIKVRVHARTLYIIARTEYILLHKLTCFYKLESTIFNFDNASSDTLQLSEKKITSVPLPLLFAL